MKIEQRGWTSQKGWEVVSNDLNGQKPQLVFIFGGREEITEQDNFNSLKKFYPDAHLLLASTAGEILGTKVSEHSISVTAVHFEKTNLQFAQANIDSAANSESRGREVAGQLKKEGLSHVMVFSDGLKVNGTALVGGITKELPADVSVTGGLVGDGSNFKKTVTGLDALPTEGKIILVGFYGENLEVGYGSLGGWDPFGPERLITKSKANVLFELDGKPALRLYKEYLGEQAENLPSSGLLFPLNLKYLDEKGEEIEVVRTLLGVDEKEQSMTFAGDMPEKAHVNLMKANFDRLVVGARGAAKMSSEGIANGAPELAILISCIGRKLVLKERIEEETEATQKELGETTKMAGFYSYGEISPVAPTEKQCRLHNQTMTITTFKEK